MRCRAGVFKSFHLATVPCAVSMAATVVGRRGDGACTVSLPDVERHTASCAPLPGFSAPGVTRGTPFPALVPHAST